MKTKIQWKILVLVTKILALFVSSHAMLFMFSIHVDTLHFANLAHIISPNKPIQNVPHVESQFGITQKFSIKLLRSKNKLLKKTYLRRK